MTVFWFVTSFPRSVTVPLPRPPYGKVMDMTTGVQFSEDYSDPNADIWLYSEAASPFPKPDDYEGPDGYWEYLQQVQPEGNHGDAFHYKTINSDMLGWIISRVADQAVTDMASERLWRPMGAEQDALPDGRWQGCSLCRWRHQRRELRDLGRLGLLMLNEGTIDGIACFPGGGCRQNPRWRRSGQVRWVPHNPKRQLYKSVSGSSTMKMVPTRHVVCTARQSMWTRQPRWFWCAWPPFRMRRTA